MEIIYKKVQELIPYVNNSRTHSEQQVNQICASINEFGFTNPLLIDEKDSIIAGHGRLMASKKLGMEEVPCIVLKGLTEAQKKAYIIADNKMALNAGWDEELLKIELENLKELDFDLGLTGFNIDELDDILDKNEEEIGIVEDDFEIEVSEEPKAKLGDIYQLGNHRLMCGDSTSITDIYELLNDNKIDMIFTDPPYGMNLDTDFSGMKSKIFKGGNGGNEYDAGIVDDFNPEMINTIMALDIKETFLWGADYFAELLPNKNDGSWIVWDKRANGNDDIAEDYSSDKMYGSCFELCWSKTKHKRDIARVKWAGMFGMEKQDNKKRLHPTQKPLELCNWFITRYSKDNSNILDLFGGSGSTLIACEQLNRNCYMMELDPKYIDVIIDRWEQYTGQKAVLLNKGELK